MRAVSLSVRAKSVAIPHFVSSRCYAFATRLNVCVQNIAAPAPVPVLEGDHQSCLHVTAAGNDSLAGAQVVRSDIFLCKFHETSYAYTFGTSEFLIYHVVKQLIRKCLVNTENFVQRISKADVYSVFCL